MTAQASTRHPVTRAVLHATSEVTSVAGIPVWSMDAVEAGQVLVEIDQLVSRLTELQTRVAKHADAVETGAATGATSTASWLAVETRQTRSVTHRLMRLAHALDHDVYEPVRVALASGAVNPEQALVITDAVDALPDEVPDEIRGKAIRILLEEAGHHDAKDLRRLGKRILDVVAPEIAEAHEAQLLADEERRAEAATRLTMSDDGHGTTHGRFTSRPCTPTSSARPSPRSPPPSTRPPRTGRGSNGGRDPSGWAARSASSWNGSLPTCSPSRAASTRPSW